MIEHVAANASLVREPVFTRIMQVGIVVRELDATIKK